MNYNLLTIGNIFVDESGFGIKIKSKYKDALVGLDQFTYIQVVWWFDKSDNEQSRNRLIESKPYKKGPELLGTFATRSNERPNPIAISTAYVTYVNTEKAILGLAWIDSFINSPVLDIKPYIPSSDRVENVEVPNWCKHWPKNVETSGDFNWEDEFNF